MKYKREAIDLFKLQICRVPRLRELTFLLREKTFGGYLKKKKKKKIKKEKLILAF